MRTLAIVPAAGTGRRLGAGRKKPFVLLKGKPLVSYALKTLDRCGAVDSIIIAVERSSIRAARAVVKKFRLKKVADIVVGGRTRSESVANCLKKAGSSFDIILVHDGGRPLVEESLIIESIRGAARYGACIAAVPESDTVKLAGKRLFVKKTLARDTIFRAQTPQAFRSSLIKKVYGRRKGSGATDDAFLVESAGRPVKIAKGSYRNIKITTREDLRIAEALL